MCLRYSAKITEKIKNSKQDYIIAYKVLLNYGINKLTSSIHKHYVWKPGWNRHVGDSHINLNFKNREFLIFGLHVFLHLKTAKRFNYAGIIVPVKCYKRDLIAAGYYNLDYSREAMFKKVFLSKKDYVKAFAVQH